MLVVKHFWICPSLTPTRSFYELLLKKIILILLKSCFKDTILLLCTEMMPCRHNFRIFKLNSCFQNTILIKIHYNHRIILHLHWNCVFKTWFQDFHTKNRVFNTSHCFTLKIRLEDKFQYFKPKLYFQHMILICITSHWSHVLKTQSPISSLQKIIFMSCLISIHRFENIF